MGRLSARNQLIIGIGIVLVLALVVVFLAIVPTFKKVSEVGAQIKVEEQNLATAQALLQRRQSAKANSAVSETDLMRIANQIPDTPQLPSVIIEIQDVANASEVDLDKIIASDLSNPPAGPQGVPAYAIVPLTLDIRSQWDGVITFMRKLADLNRGVRVVKSTYTYVPPGQGDDESYLSAKVDIQVYVMPSAAGSGMPSQSATSTVPAQ